MYVPVVAAALIVTLKLPLSSVTVLYDIPSTMIVTVLLAIAFCVYSSLSTPDTSTVELILVLLTGFNVNSEPIFSTSNVVSSLLGVYKSFPS